MNSSIAPAFPPSRPQSSAATTHLPINPLPNEHSLLHVRPLALVPLAAAATTVRRQSSQGSSVFDDFHGSSESAASSSSTVPQSAGIIGLRQQQQYRSSWSNLVNNSAAGDVGRSKLPNSCDGYFGQMSTDPPPPYDQFHLQQKQQRNQNYKMASRQSSNASGGTAASVPFSLSKGSSSYFHMEVGNSPPFPLMAAAPYPHQQFRTQSSGMGARSVSAQSSSHQGGGGRLSSAAGSGSSRRELQPRKKRDRMQELRDLWARPGCRLCCLAILILFICLLIAIAIFTSHLALPQHLEFAWFAPEQFRRTPGSAAESGIISTGGGAAPNRGRLDVGQHGQQVRLELNGAQPFRSNFISVLDFKTNQVAIVDLSLRSGQRSSICFVMDLDRQNIKNIDTLLRAAKNGAERKNQLHGWEESWLWSPQPLSQSPIFQPEMAECRDARWVQLIRAGTDQKGQKCTECFDFCLPDWGIDSDAIRDQQYLNIVRRICFSLFVPEWRPFAQSLGWQQNQHDFEQFYRSQQQQQNLQQQGGLMAQFNNNNNNAQQGQNTETKWISLQTPPYSPPTNMQKSGNAVSTGVGSILSPSNFSQNGQTQQQWPYSPIGGISSSSAAVGNGPISFQQQGSSQSQTIWPFGQPQPQSTASIGSANNMNLVGTTDNNQQQWPSMKNLQSPPQQQFTDDERQNQQMVQRWLMKWKK